MSTREYPRLNVAGFSLQTTLVLRVYHVHIVLGWSEVKTVQQKIATTCKNMTNIRYARYVAGQVRVHIGCCHLALVLAIFFRVLQFAI